MDVLLKFFYFLKFFIFFIVNYGEAILKKKSGLLNLPLGLFVVVVVERTGGIAQILWHGKG